MCTVSLCTRAGILKGRASPPPPSYHKLSLDVIRSLTGERLNTRPGSRSAADARGPLSGSKGKGSPSQKLNGQQKAVSAHSVPQHSSAGVAVASKGSVVGMGKTGAAGKAVPTVQQSDLTPRKKQTTFKFEDVKEHITDTSALGNNWLLSEATFTQRIMQQMSYTGSHESDGRLFLEVRPSPSPAPYPPLPPPSGALPLFSSLLSLFSSLLSLCSDSIQNASTCYHVCCALSGAFLDVIQNKHSRLHSVQHTSQRCLQDVNCKVHESGLHTSMHGL